MSPKPPRLHLSLAATLILALSLAAVALAWPGADAGRGPVAAPASPEPLPPPTAGCDRRIQSRAFLVADARGRELASLAADRRRPVASITKLMTARLVLERGALTQTVSVPPLRLASDEARAGLETGRRLRRATLLKLLLVASANDAAETLAATSASGRAGFVRDMNTAARRLGLKDTRYANPSGMPAPGQRSTARDSVRLARALMSDPRIRAIVRLRSVPFAGHRLAATNTLLGRVGGVDGLKTGHLADDWSIVATSTGRGGRLYAAVLGAPTETIRDRDANCLLSVGRRLLAR